MVKYFKEGLSYRLETLCIKIYDVHFFFQIDTWSSMLAFSQIKGQNKVKLTPKMPCDKMCEAFEDTLDEGEICK